MPGLKRFAFVVASLLLAGLATSAALAQSDYPNRPVRLIVGFIPGSSADITARVLGQRMGQILGHQFVVEGKPGAGSSLAAEFVARAPKDGYTLFIASSANITNAAINPNLPFDISKDFTPIALINTAAVILVVHPSTGVKTVQELIALAKSKPGEILYASTGVGTAPHLSGELLSMRAGLKLVHVPYQGSPQAATDLLAGRVAMMFSPASAVVSQVEAGSLRVLASAATKRPGILPNVPTMAEAGARFRHLDLVRPDGARRHAARGDRQARGRGARGALGERGGGGLAPAGHRSAQRRSGAIRPPHREREQALERRRNGGGAEEVIAALFRTGDLLAEHE